MIGLMRCFSFWYDPTAIILSPDRANALAERLSSSIVIILALWKTISAPVVVCPRSVLQEIKTKWTNATEIIGTKQIPIFNVIFLMTDLLNNLFTLIKICDRG